MKLIFERSVDGVTSSYIPDRQKGVPEYIIPDKYKRTKSPNLPRVPEVQISRHYTRLARNTFGVNNGFYPLGSCTMKYNPVVHEKIVSLPGFKDIHPLQSPDTIQGALEVLYTAEKYFCEITGMDAMSFQPAAGAHGEFTGILLIKAYHLSRGDTHRTKILVPDSAHGTNPATAAMAGFDVVTIPSNSMGRVDLDLLKSAIDENIAGIMLTNPNTLGIFESDVPEITRLVHEAGGLAYYDGANLNAVMGKVRPGDMDFDVIHLNLHKTFSTPHGGGGPGSGPVGCKSFLKEFLPGPVVVKAENKNLTENRCTKENKYLTETGYTTENQYTTVIPEKSIGRVKSFYGNFLVSLKALAYAMTLGSEGIRQSSEQAVLNSNYMKKKLEGHLETAFKVNSMHEFVLTLSKLKKETGVSALDFAKGLLDEGMHPPTMYFPLIVQEALMVEPTETESLWEIDEAVDAYIKLYNIAYNDPQYLKDAPHTTNVKRPDEVQAARNPILKYDFNFSSNLSSN